MASPCPLCGDPLDDDEAYREHLRDVHDLVDEPGTASTLPVQPDEVLAPASVQPPAPPSWDVPAPGPNPPVQKRGGGKERAVTALAIIIAIAIIGVAYVAIVRGNDSTPAVEGATPTTTSPQLDPDLRTPEQHAAHDAAASAVFITLEDLPEGWRVSDRESKPSSPQDQEKLNELWQCVGFDVSTLPFLVDDSGRVGTSGEFLDDAGRTIENEVGTVATAHNADLARQRFARLFGSRCYAAFAEQGLAAGDTRPDVSPEQLEMVSIDPAAIRGDAVWSRAAFAMRGERRYRTEANLDFIILTKGRWITSIVLVAANAPFPKPLAIQIANSVLGRMPAS